MKKVFLLGAMAMFVFGVTNLHAQVKDDTKKGKFEEGKPIEVPAEPVQQNDSKVVKFQDANTGEQKQAQTLDCNAIAPKQEIKVEGEEREAKPHNESK